MASMSLINVFTFLLCTMFAVFCGNCQWQHFTRCVPNSICAANLYSLKFALEHRLIVWIFRRGSFKGVASGWIRNHDDALFHGYKLMDMIFNNGRLPFPCDMEWARRSLVWNPTQDFPPKSPPHNCSLCHKSPFQGNSGGLHHHCAYSSPSFLFPFEVRFANLAKNQPFCFGHIRPP